MKIKALETKILEEMDENALRLESMILDLVDGRTKLKDRHRQEFKEYEENMLHFFWQCRGKISTSSMARMLNISRQALYQKWNAHGYVVSDTAAGRDGE